MAKISSARAELADLEEDGFPLDAQGLLFTLLRRSWLVVLAAIVAGLAIWALTRKMPTLYQSAALLQIEVQEQKALALPDNSQSNLQNPEVVETIIEKFRGRVLMERVNKSLGLATDPKFLGFTPDSPVPDDLVIAILLNGSQAALRPKTRLIDVTFTHTNREVAFEVVNAMVNEFLKQDDEQRAETLEAQNRVLVQKAQELKDRVTHSEQALQDYKQKLASVSLEDRRNLVEEKLKGMNTDLTGAKAERLRLESDAQQAKLAAHSTEQLLAIPSIAQDPQVVAARERLTREEETITTLSQRYGERHPRMIEERAQLEAAREGVAAAARTAPDRIGSRYVAARAQEDGLQHAVQEQEAALLDMDAKVIPFRALQREYDSDRTLFESVLQRLKESNLQLGVQTVDFHVVEPAQTARPVPGRRFLFIAVGALAGAGLVAGMVVLWFFLHQSVSSVESAERLLKLPVLAAVPKMRLGNHPAEAVAAMSRPGSPEAESFRTLRTGLQLLSGAAPQVILITSAVPAEGKSVTAGNLAAAFAQLGLRTLLIEADLRRPSLDGLFQASPEGAPGLGEYLKGTAVNRLPTGQIKLDFLPAGRLLDDPAEALASHRFGDLIQQMKREYDRVIIDTAPVNVVSDTLNIVAWADLVCLVVRSDVTPQRLIKRTVELLKRGGVRPDGIILNWSSDWIGRKYHGYYHGGPAYGGTRAQPPPSKAASGVSA